MGQHALVDDAAQRDFRDFAPKQGLVNRVWSLHQGDLAHRQRVGKMVEWMYRRCLYYTLFESALVLSDSSLFEFIWNRLLELMRSDSNPIATHVHVTIRNHHNPKSVAILLGVPLPLTPMFIPHLSNLFATPVGDIICHESTTMIAKLMYHGIDFTVSPDQGNEPDLEKWFDKMRNTVQVIECQYSRMVRVLVNTLGTDLTRLALDYW